MKRPLAPVVALLLVPLAAVYAEPPQGPPRSLPTTPAEVAAFLRAAEEGEAWRQELVQHRGEAKNAYGAAMNALRYGPFKKAGGLEEAEYKRLLAIVSELDRQMKLTRESMAAAEKAGDKDERAALEIEGQRLRARKDAAQTAADSLVVSRCLALPDGKAAAQEVQRLAQKAQEADAAASAYGDTTLSVWRNLAQMYRQKAPGVDFTKTRTIRLAPPADAEKRLAAFAERNHAESLEQLAHRLFRSLDERARGLERPFSLYREKKFAEALDAFRDYFLDKLVHLERYGIPPDAVITDAYAPLSPAVFPSQWSDDALRGVATMAIDPGYDLRVIVDAEEWWPAMRWHALGTWSRALAKGPHRFRVIFTDTRTEPLKHETWMNWPNPAVLWKDAAPALELSGPGLAKGPVPQAWLRQEIPGGN